MLLASQRRRPPRLTQRPRWPDRELVRADGLRSLTRGLSGFPILRGRRPHFSAGNCETQDKTSGHPFAERPSHPSLILLAGSRSVPVIELRVAQTRSARPGSRLGLRLTTFSTTAASRSVFAESRALVTSLCEFDQQCVLAAVGLIALSHSLTFSRCLIPCTCESNSAFS